MDLKQIPTDASSFEANGVTYFVKDSLSVERFRWFEKYQVNFGFAKDFKGIYDALVKCIALANKGKGVEAWNIVFNLQEAVGKNLDDRAHSAMYICALFLVTETEDLTVWDEQMAKAKIDNWNAEGYDVNCFFRLAANLVSGYIDILEEIFRNTSELAETATLMNQSGAPKL